MGKVVGLLSGNELLFAQSPLSAETHNPLWEIYLRSRWVEIYPAPIGEELPNQIFPVKEQFSKRSPGLVSLSREL